MRVIGINHLVNSGNSLEGYFNKFVDGLATARVDGIDGNIIVGPDYGLYVYSDVEGRKIDFESTGKIIEYFKALSLVYPNTLILPGTMPLKKAKDKLAHLAPGFLNGNLSYRFFKETDCGEADLAKDNGLVYHKGNNSNNFLGFDDKLITVEICSDHGKQKVEPETFLEVIMAYDKFGGFHVNAINDNFSRYALVCNALNKTADKKTKPVECHKYSLIDEEKRKLLEPVIDDSNFRIYDLEDL